jgi:transcriptional regulator with XRE-family HTH domain
VSKYDINIFTDNLQYYIDKCGKQQKDIAKVVGVSTGTFCDWVKGRAFPRIDKLQTLADYFEISISDLIENKTLPNNLLSIEQQKVLDLYNKIPKDKTEIVIDFLQTLK